MWVFSGCTGLVPFIVGIFPPLSSLEQNEVTHYMVTFRGNGIKARNVSHMLLKNR